MQLKFHQELQDRFEKEGIIPYEVKCFIADDNGNWVDFSENPPVNGTNRLVALGNISHTTEDKEGIGAFHTKTGDIVMDNSDNFWDSPISGLSDIDGSSATFSKSKNEQMSVFHRHKLRISVMVLMKSGSPVEVPLGTFLIEDIIFNNNHTISIKTVGLAKPLMEHSAEPIKDGLGPHQNKSVKFLLEELLKLEYGEIRGSAANNRWRVPTTFILAEKIYLSNATGQRTIGHFGRPPEYDGTVWQNKGLTCRAICMAGIDDDGDVPAPVEDLYLGCDDELWYYDTSEDKYILIDETSINTSLSGAKIRKLWFNDVVNTRIYGVATTDPTTTSRTVSMIIFSWDGTTFTVEVEDTAGNRTNNVFVGDFHYRTGAVDGSDTEVGGYTTGGSPACEGENIATPFAQFVVAANGATDKNLKGKDVVHRATPIAGDDDSDDYTITGGPGTGISVKSNYYGALWTGGAGADVGIKYTSGQQGCIVFCPNAATDGVIIWFSYDSGADKYFLNYYVIDGSVTTDFWNEKAGNFNHQPLCGCTDSGDDVIYFATTAFDEGTSVINEIKLNKFDYNSGTPSVSNIVSGGVLLYMVPLEMIHIGTAPDTYKLYVSLFNKRYEDTQVSSGLPKYRIAKYDTSTGNVTTIVNPPFQPKGFVQGSTDDSGDSYGDIYYMNVGPGSLSKIDIDGVTTKTLDFGWPAVDGDTNLACVNMAVDTDSKSGTDSDIIWGISAPAYPSWFYDSNDPVEGKYYLFKLDSDLPARVELADFEGMKIWQALKMLAQMTNYFMGFTTDGNFFFVPREIDTATADYTLKSSPEENTIIDISKNSGYKEIYNYASVTPYKGVLQDIQKPEFIIRKREVGKEFDSRFAVDQRDNLRKNIRMTCTHGGTIADSDSRFKWLFYSTPVEVIVSQTYTANSTKMYLSSVFGGDNEDNGIHSNDYIAIIKPSDNTEQIHRIDSVDSAANSIDFAASDEFDFNINSSTAAIILKEHKLSTAVTGTETHSKWSDRGVTFQASIDKASATTHTLHSVDDLSVDTLIQFEGLVTTARITAVDTSNVQVTLDQTVDTSGLSGSPKVYAWYSPKHNGATTKDTDFQEIGGTNIFIQWQTKSGGNNTFREGDGLYAQAPGLKLEQEDQSRQVYTNVTSIGKYKRREFPNVDNKLINRRLARNLARKIVNEYSDPKYIITSNILFSPHILFLNNNNAQLRVDVQDKRMFFSREEFLEKSLIRSIIHNVNSGKSTIVVRGKDFY